jgi:hypothetical protein
LPIASETVNLDPALNARSSSLFIAATVFALAIAVAYALGQSYIGRLPNHAGYFLVSVDDAVDAPPPRPRHAVFVLVDGLTLAAAEKLDATKRLAREGQCRVMEVGPITISRPVYAVLSTGLEEDRTGSRNNDETSPLAAQSVWQVARQAGLMVNAVSAVPWWKQLFTDGFSRYEVIAVEDDPFGPTELADVNLVHPLYVDETGHNHGAASAEYANAVGRVDRDLVRFLERVDLARDLIVLTADHGHTSYGGHGALQPELTHVLTCFAGRGVARRADVGRMDARSLGPAFALLTGLPFPRNMRAGEDDLDLVFDIADARAFPAEYLENRHAAVERFRAKNAASLENWLGAGTPATWTNLYAREGRAQAMRLAASAVASCLLFWGIVWRRGIGARGAVSFLLWASATLAATLAVYAAVRGSLDFTSINARKEFLRAALSVCAGVGLVAWVAHRRIFANLGRFVGDEVTLVALGAAACLLHVFVYRWPLGFPVPGPGALFFPFLAPIFVIVHALIGVATTAFIFWRARR